MAVNNLHRKNQIPTLENASAYKEMNVLYGISQAIVRAEDFDDILNLALNLLRDIYSYYHVQVYWAIEGGKKLTYKDGSGEIGFSIKEKGHEITLEHGVVGYVANSGQAFMTNDVLNVPFYLQNQHLPETRAELAIPINIRDEISGVLDIHHKNSNQFDDRDLRLATSVADQLSVAYEREALYKELQDALQKESSTRAQLIQSEKLAAMGRLVSSVAHELNNPLQAIQNALYLIRMEDTLSDQSEEDIQVALSETARMAELISRLRETYRPRGETDFSIESLNKIVDETHKLLATHLRHNNIAFGFSPDQNLPKIPMIRDQIKQVILNLALNAIESMPSGGELKIQTNFLSENSNAQILIFDSGTGIDPELLPNIFEPFFTTKPKGSGLGLAISYEIIQRHSGKINVKSKVDSGTTVEVLLPIER